MVLKQCLDSEVIRFLKESISEVMHKVLFKMTMTI